MVGMGSHPRLTAAAFSAELGIPIRSVFSVETKACCVRFIPIPTVRKLRFGENDIYLSDAPSVLAIDKESRKRIVAPPFEISNQEIASLETVMRRYSIPQLVLKH